MRPGGPGAVYCGWLAPWSCFILKESPLPTRISLICDKLMEAGWLAAVVFTPLYFNVYSSRVFEPDKISFLRNIVIMMTLAWIIKVAEAAWVQRQGAATPSRRGAVAEAIAPSTGLLGRLPAPLRVPMVLPILIYAAVYVLTSTPLVSIVPLTSLFGSYQRLQGLLSQSAYILLALIIIANMRSRAQFERIITFCIATSIPVALYGILQFSGHDPLPWAGDVQTRVASSMGNAIFVAAWLIMVVPLTLSRFLQALNSLRHPEDELERPADQESILPLAVIGSAAMFVLLLFQYVGMMTGDSPDGKITAGDIFAWVFALLVLGLFVLLAWRVSGTTWRMPVPRGDDVPSMTPVLLGVAAPVLQIVIFWAALNWVGTSRVNDFSQWIVLPAAIFIFYALSFLFATEGRASHMALLIQVVALPMLMALQGLVIFLTQSRGPQIGLLAGLLVFLAGMIYVVRGAWRRYAGSLSRSRGALIGAGSLAGLMVIAVLLAVVGAEVNILLAMLLGMVVYAMLVFGMILWANRERSRELAEAEVGFTGGAVALLLVGVLLIGAVLVVFNLPESPLAAYRSLPYVGRLGTLLQADEGTGKVRTLIWSGAEKMILDSPLRTLLGWGPEGMYVGYNRFYPPDLAHWELRNATPDRSHDFYIDQLVTMGVVGLAAYLLLAVAFFAYAIMLLRRSRTLMEQLITLGLLAMVTAHLVEGLTGIQIAATYTYFYMGLALLSVWGFYLTGYLRPQVRAANGVPAANEANLFDEALGENGPLDGDGNGSEPVLASTPLAASTPVSKAAPRTNGHSTTPPPGTARPPGSGAKGGKKGFTVVTPTPAPTGARRAAPPSTAAATAPPVPGARRPIPAGAATRATRPSSRTVARSGLVATRSLASPALLVGYAVLTLIALWGIVGINVGNVKADMFYKQGLAYDNSGQWPGSIGPYTRAISLAPNEDFYYLFLGRAYMEWAKNRSQFDSVLAPGQNLPATDLLKLSEQALLRAKALNPMNTDHYANLGRLYSWWGSSDGGGDASKLPLSVQAYETAHRYSPGNAQLWNELGLAYYKAGRYQDAVDALHGSIAMDDRFALSYFVLGEIQRSESISRAAQDPAAGARLAAEAADAYAKAVLLDPSQIYDKDFQSRVDWLSNTQTITPVIVAYQQVLSTTPDSTIASTALGYIYSSRNNLTGAIAQYEQAVSRQCGDFYSLQNLATVYNEVGRKADALAAYRKALAVATCNTGDPYAAQCPALKTSCTPLLTSNPDMSDELNRVQLAISTLQKELNP